MTIIKVGTEGKVTLLRALAAQVFEHERVRIEAEKKRDTIGLVLAAHLLREWKLDVTSFSIEVDDQAGANGYHFDCAYVGIQAVSTDVELPDYMSGQLGIPGNLYETLQDNAIDFLRETSLDLTNQPWVRNAGTNSEGYVTHAEFDIDGLIRWHEEGTNG